MRERAMPEEVNASEADLLIDVMKTDYKLGDPPAYIVCEKG